MDAETRQLIKSAIDNTIRSKLEQNVVYRSCDPEDLSIAADRAEEQGYPEVAGALRRFRDMVVNPLLGEGWTLDRIEAATFNHFKNKQI